MVNKSAKAPHQSTPDFLVGGDILNLITSGMYASPLAIYREYLQNAADSIASSRSPHNGKVEIKIDLNGQRVTIRDNGPGLSYAQAKNQLIPISRSSKRRQYDRGFRGIGRLSGLAFGDAVTFLTRASEKEPVTQMIWDREKLRDGISRKLSVEDIIKGCVTVSKIDGDNYPSNFFEVQIGGIPKYAASYILNKDAVRQYLGEVCPVPFDTDFPYKANISNLFNGQFSSLILDVYIDGEITPITRPHQDGICVLGGKIDDFVGFEEIKIPALGDGGYAAIGWIAHSSYLGAIQKTSGIRGVRVRVGNIQVGDETVFDHHFSESRFNRWCVGEIYIVDAHIIPNGRRDYFEPGAHLRNLENHLGAICRKIERRCRMASKQRNKHRHLEDFLDSLESTYDLVTSGYLAAREARQYSARILAKIPDFREKYEVSNYAREIKRLDALEAKLSNYQFPPGRCSFSGVNPPDIPIYRKIFKILAETSPTPRQAKKAIEVILNYDSM